MNGLIASFASYRPKIEDAVVKGTGVPLNSVKIRPPLPAPKTIDCMAVNYMEDGTRSAPAPINAFHKSPSTICGDGDTMVSPDVPATIFEGEAEMTAKFPMTDWGQDLSKDCHTAALRLLKPLPRAHGASNFATEPPKLRTIERMLCEKIVLRHA